MLISKRAFYAPDTVKCDLIYSSLECFAVSSSVPRCIDEEIETRKVVNSPRLHHSSVGKLPFRTQALNDALGTESFLNDYPESTWVGRCPRGQRRTPLRKAGRRTAVGGANGQRGRPLPSASSLGLGRRASIVSSFQIFTRRWKSRFLVEIFFQNNKKTGAPGWGSPFSPQVMISG